MAFLPKPLGDLQRLDLEVFPPGHFIACLMQLPVMTAAERDGELVADFEADGPRLSKAQVMRIARLSAADKTGLRGNEFEMRLVAKTLGLGDGEDALIDLPWHKAGRCGNNRATGGPLSIQFTPAPAPDLE